VPFLNSDVREAHVIRNDRLHGTLSGAPVLTASDLAVI
jgi:hypothetical protein